MSQIAAGLFVLSGVLAACTAPPPKTTECGPASALVAHPSDIAATGAPLGPLLIRNFEPGATTAVVHRFTPGRPTKMVVLVARDMVTDISLTGARCADGKPLRFWLNKDGGGPFTFGPDSTPVPEDVMSSVGDVRAVLPRIDPPTMTGVWSYGGYLLFPTAGSYRIEAQSEGKTVGEAILVVTTEPPAGPGFRDGYCEPSGESADLGLIGGDLAARGAQDLAARGTVKVLWRRKTDVGTSLSLVADRLDAPGHLPLGTFVLTGSAEPGRNGYMTGAFPSDITLDAAGCWRISDVNGAPTDFIVVRALPARPRDLAYGPGERDAIRKLQDARFRVDEVAPSVAQGLVASAQARWIGTSEGAFDLLLFADPAIAPTVRVCGQPATAGTYRYVLTAGERSTDLVGQQTFFVVAKDSLALVYGSAALAATVRAALSGRDAPC